ncbi:BTB/POZ domain-containing protein At5g47800 isoform X1 [Arachis duranensis]|uniref:BTB/POZ domain-containing protein At5g47800 isoform X1 n=2 Tax=Arachis TaxID=3817 RepID=A0A6P5MIW2_ARADU|nr:BTB/POZ domain-containing protein At5g47800 isoform X1 [Arachis duranensis]XP_020982748.1 BTB/POZ domain-containing protein At5g47800 isoform X1 [Arachis duranensis]XP_025613715.1 BTB/POZ domain-containing protein At5g47800 isoform X1 [Arachis hypogaea]XP_029143974.1 BTB/POZ domain-containing protein At5g47800 isoform X1 [Arachis hypogaea]XP_029143975.1 BTB/POZ domain-containing protein At5g47800 isoform X1 [Arachis hypogaea]XP_057755244.1 BTB/POZ domain-containing protein At5g47800-like is
MKFMKLGTRPDTFFTEQATRTLISEIPADLVIQINDITYLLHKLQFPLLPKCGLLQRLCYDSSDSESFSLELHDIPGGEEAFELCAKFCYGISINISAHNFVSALCAAKFLRMNDSIEKGNFVGKLEAFFNSCLLEGWKDSIATLQTTATLPEWSENLGIVRKCIDSIIEKVLTPPQQVKWSYTYTRPGYNKKQHHSVPKDWWTEDISDLDIDLFRCIVMAVRSTYVLPPQLIGEALHVYACRWLPGVTKLRYSGSSASQTDESKAKNRKILETIVSMIPADRGSVSVGFLFRLLSISIQLGVSSVTKTELIRRASLQFEEATVSDLLYPSKSSSDQNYYDIELVLAVLETFLKLWKRMSPGAVDSNYFLRSIRNVGKLIDSYLQVVARDENMLVSKFVSLAETVPGIARVEHDDLYQAVNIYLKVHPDLNKTDKKRLCGILDCQRLSPEARAHAVKNELLPLRTVVQLLYFEQEKGSTNKGEITTNKLPKPHEVLLGAKHRPRDAQSKQSLALDKEELNVEEATTRASLPPESREKKTLHHLSSKRLDGKLPLDLERKMVIKGDIEETGSEREKVRGHIREESVSSCKLELDPKKIIQRARSKSEHGREKGR